MRFHHNTYIQLLLICTLPTGGYVFGQSREMKVFLLEDQEKNRWCAFRQEQAWKTEVEAISATTVGILAYVDDKLIKIDLTQEADSADWIVYDHYRVDGAGEITKLSRIINVLPGDRSVQQEYDIHKRKFRKAATVQKQLSTGKVLENPEAVWLPDLPVLTSVKDFRFADIIPRAGKIDDKLCTGMGPSK